MPFPGSTDADDSLFIPNTRKFAGNRHKRRRRRKVAQSTLMSCTPSPNISPPVVEANIAEKTVETSVENTTPTLMEIEPSDKMPLQTDPDVTPGDRTSIEDIVEDSSKDNAPETNIFRANPPRQGDIGAPPGLEKKTESSTTNLEHHFTNLKKFANRKKNALKMAEIEAKKRKEKLEKSRKEQEERLKRIQELERLAQLEQEKRRVEEEKRIKDLEEKRKALERKEKEERMRLDRLKEEQKHQRKEIEKSKEKVDRERKKVHQEKKSSRKMEAQASAIAEHLKSIGVTAKNLDDPEIRKVVQNLLSKARNARSNSRSRSRSRSRRRRRRKSPTRSRR